VIDVRLLGCELRVDGPTSVSCARPDTNDRTAPVSARNGGSFILPGATNLTRCGLPWPPHDHHRSRAQRRRHPGSGVPRRGSGRLGRGHRLGRPPGFAHRRHLGRSPGRGRAAGRARAGRRVRPLHRCHRIGRRRPPAGASPFGGHAVGRVSRGRRNVGGARLRYPLVIAARRPGAGLAARGAPWPGPGRHHVALVVVQPACRRSGP
jgi:hypothetical protein